MNSKYKHRIISILILASSIIYIYFTFIFFTKQNINLNSVSKFSGIIENIEIKNIGTKTQHKAVALNLKGLSQKLWLLKHDENYEKYLSQIEIGDTIKVYYLENDIVQIEKNSQIVIAKSEYESEQRRRLWLVIVGGIFIIALSALYYRKKI